MCAREHDSDRWWNDRSMPQKIFMGIGFGILGVGLLFLIGLVTMLLWNALMPDIFGVKTITYWQSWGLLILSFILFKSWGSGESSGRKDRKRKRHLRRYMSEDGYTSKDGGETGSASSEPETADEAKPADETAGPPDPPLTEDE